MGGQADAVSSRMRVADRLPSRLRAGLVIVGASWGLAVAAVVIAALAGPPYNVPGDFLILYLGYAVVWGPVAALFAGRSLTGLATIAAAQSIGAGLGAVLIALARVDIGHPGAQGFLLHVADRPGIPGALASLAVLPVLLTTRRLSQPERIFIAAGVTAATIPALLAPLRQRAELTLPNPIAADPSWQPVLMTVIVASFTVAVICGVVSLVIALRRWLWGPVDDRRGQGWVVLGQSMLVLFASPIYLPVLPEWSAAVDRVSPLTPFAALLFMPAVAVLVSMRRRPGWEVAVNRAVVNVLLMLGFIATYSTIATTVALTLPVAPLIAGVLGVAVLVLVIDPGRRWIQARVDALIFGDAADPAQLIRRLGEHLPREEPGGELQVLADELRDALRLARLELRPADPGAACAGSGEGGGPAAWIPLRSSEGDAGWIIAAAPGYQRVDRRTLQVLERVSGAVAITMRLAEVTRETLAAGERVREVGAEERRMVARELEEGLGPGLARSVERLERVPALVISGSRETGAELDGVRAELAERTREVRDLARTLLPGALDSGDVDQALQELAERFSSARLDVAVEGVLGDAVHEGREAAVHHLVAELVLLARRAPGARRARIRITVDRRSVHIMLMLDTAERAQDEAPIVASIHDRAVELGGQLRDAVGEDSRSLAVELPR